MLLFKSGCKDSFYNFAATNFFAKKISSQEQIIARKEKQRPEAYLCPPVKRPFKYLPSLWQ